MTRTPAPRKPHKFDNLCGPPGSPQAYPYQLLTDILVREFGQPCRFTDVHQNWYTSTSKLFFEIESRGLDPDRPGGTSSVGETGWHWVPINRIIATDFVCLCHYVALRAIPECELRYHYLVPDSQGGYLVLRKDGRDFGEPHEPEGLMELTTVQEYEREALCLDHNAIVQVVSALRAYREAVTTLLSRRYSDGFVDAGATSVLEVRAQRIEEGEYCG